MYLFNSNYMYYQRKIEAEIDFILNNKIAYEVKNTATMIDAKRLKRSLQTAKLNRDYLVSKNFTTGVDNVVFGQFL